MIAAPTPETPAHCSPQGQTARRRWIGLRAMLLAFLFAPLTAWWTTDQGIDVIFSLMIPPVMMTVAVAAGNLMVRRFAPRWALTEGELIIFYGMQTVVGAICAEWMMVTQPYIYSYALYAGNDSRFDRHINPFTHPWFFIPRERAELFTDFRNGGFPLPYILTRLHLWWPYILSWTALFSLVGLAMLCINSLMRDQWTHREKLAFPIIQLPMAVVQVGAGKARPWRNRWFLGPFLVMFAIDGINGLHFLYPSVPLINVRFLADVSQWFPAPPWNTIGWTPVGIFPYMAVIGFFMPTDLLFSCIFFFLLRKLTQVFTYAIGYTESEGTFGGGSLVPGPPYFSEQSWGAFLALFVTAIWTARHYLKEVWRQIVRGHPAGDPGVPHRLAFAGLLFSLAAIGGLSVFIIGIPPVLVAVTVGLFLAFSVALTRMRAQIGAPSHEMAFMGPTQLIVDFAGTQNLPQAGISRMATMFHFMNRIHRTHPMPHQLEAMKMGDMARINQRALFLAIIVATVVGCVLGHLCYIYKGYRFTPSAQGGEVAGVVSTLIDQRRPPNPVAMLFVGVGFGVVLTLDFVRFRLPGFPLHPAGYALAMNFGLDYFWFGLILVWLIKLFVERYYGLRGHGALHQVALGVILAEFCAETIWAVYAMIYRQATYSVSINGRLGWNQ